ncbi:MAG: hypothetical protein KIT85_12405 [Pseudolabrys sp.]|nr:hypothetical protein [Pseudolabrys sp.]MCW5685200.1 hypothetical protein [Pseudolabrys sp.]
MPGHLPRHPQTYRASWPGALIIGVAFLALMGAALLTQHRSAVSVPVIQKQARAPDTTGRSFLPTADGRTCRELTFDRVTSEIIESRTRACWLPEVSDEPEFVTAPVPAAGNASRNGARNGFRWGQTAPGG